MTQIHGCCFFFVVFFFKFTFFSFCVNVFGQVTCDATGQVLCLGPEYRAKLSIVLLIPPSARVDTPPTEDDRYQELPGLRKYFFSNFVFLGWLCQCAAGDE